MPGTEDPHAPRGAAGRIGFGLALVLFLAGGYLAGGFVRFAEEVSGFRTPKEIARSDGIVVLTGGALRLDQAIGLLKDGRAGRLLISGVNPGTSIETLSKLTDTDKSWFDCCVDIDYAALNTIGNAAMADRWAKMRGFDELILVTSDYHMPRTLLEFERFADGPVIRPYPVGRSDLWTENRMPNGQGFKVLLTEYAKLLAARLRFATGIEAPAAATVKRNDRRSAS